MEDRGFSDRGFSDLLSTASKLLKSQSNSGSQSSQSHSASQTVQSQTSNPSSNVSAGYHGGQPPSQAEIMASAQVIMNAAKSKMRKGDEGSAEEFDMGKLAGAASTILGAASHYGKIENSAYGKYAQKAEEYLNSYEAKHGKINVAQPGTASQSQGHGSGQGHSVPAQGSRPAGSQGYSEGYTEPYQQKPTQSQDYPGGYTPAQGYGSGQGYSAPAQGYGSGQGYSAPAQGYGSGQGYNAPAQGYGSGQGYNAPAQGSRPAGSQGYSEGYTAPYQRKPTESQGYPVGYPPAGYPTSESKPKRNYY